jgi:hypothetical protein
VPTLTHRLAVDVTSEQATGVDGERGGSYRPITSGLPTDISSLPPLWRIRPDCGDGSRDSPRAFLHFPLDNIAKS